MSHRIHGRRELREHSMVARGGRFSKAFASTEQCMLAYVLPYVYICGSNQVVSLLLVYAAASRDIGQKLDGEEYHRPYKAVQMRSAS